MEKLSPTIGDKEREVLNKRLESISEGLRKSIEDFLTHLNATAATRG